MDGAAAHCLHKQIADLFQSQSALDRAPIDHGEFDSVRARKEIGSVEQVHVERMTLDPFSAVKEPSQTRNGFWYLCRATVLNRGARRHLVRDGANPADARRDVGGFFKASPSQEGLEKPRWLEDLEFDVFERAVSDPHVQGPFAFDARDPMHVELAVLSREVRRHVSHFPARTAVPPR